MALMSSSALLGTALIALGVSSCLPGLSMEPGASAPSPTESGSAEPCQPASQGLADRLDAALLVRGAYVSNLYVAQAADLSDSSLGLADPWWAAGRINGASLRPEVGLWLWDGSATGPTVTVISANAAASRYFAFDVADPQLAAGSSVAATVRACVGPTPEP